MSPKVGDTIRNGKDRITFKEFLGAGTYGEVWKVVSLLYGICALKILFDYLPTCLERLHFIKDFQLSRRYPGVSGILEILEPNPGRSWLGYLMEFCPGLPTDEYIQSNTKIDLYDIYTLANQFCSTFSDLHERWGICHGDIQFGNVLIRTNGNGVPSIVIIDWDNFNKESAVPLSRSPGHKRFMAPEAIQAYQVGTHFPPTIQTERCSAAKYLSLLVCRREFLCTAASEDEFIARSIAGDWDADPEQYPNFDYRNRGLPVGYTSTKIQSLFRRGLRGPAELRPSLTEWRDAFREVITDGGLSECPICHACHQLEIGRLKCPFCGHKFLKIMLQAAEWQRRVDSVQPIRRDQLPNSPTISRRHAIVTWYGSTAFVKDLGSATGTYKQINGEYLRLAPHQQIPLNFGDVLKFGETPVEVRPLS